MSILADSEINRRLASGLLVVRPLMPNAVQDALEECADLWQHLVQIKLDEFMGRAALAAASEVE